MSRYDDVNKVWDDRAFQRYSKFTDRPARHFVAAGLMIVAVIVALVFGGWVIGWWFTGQNVNRESHLLRNGYANQQTLRDQITQNIGTVLAITTQITQDPSAAGPLKAQRIAVANIVCGDAAQVTGDPLTGDQAQFVKANCFAGNISPSSSYNQR